MGKAVDGWLSRRRASEGGCVPFSNCPLCWSKTGGAKRLGVRRESLGSLFTASGSLSSSRRRHFANAWGRVGFQNAGIEATGTVVCCVMLTGFHVTSECSVQGVSFHFGSN